jgi:hypothetical protein
MTLQVRKYSIIMDFVFLKLLMKDYNEGKVYYKK